MMSLTLISDFEWLLHNWRRQFSDLHSKLESAPLVAKVKLFRTSKTFLESNSGV